MRPMRSIKPGLSALLLIALFMCIQQVRGLAQTSLKLAVQFIEGIPHETENTHAVKVYLSVVGEDGNPIRDLAPETFQLTEASNPVKIQSVGSAADEPLNIIWVLDTSDSMTGREIADAKAALVNFAAGLQRNDQMAVMTFDDAPRNQVDLTSDQAVLKERIELINAIPGSGSCLYDTVHEAVESASRIPSGNRAVIVLTDGKDEKFAGSICSVKTLEDVVHISTASETQAPIYTIGMGNRIDETALMRLADLTGGLFLKATGSPQLANTFQKLSNQLSAQYVISYTSFAGPGTHTLSATIRYSGAEDIDTRNFKLSAFSTRLTILVPQEGEIVGDRTKVLVLLSSQSEPVARVVFVVNGIEAGQDVSQPYELELGLQSYPSGDLTLSAVAYGVPGQELANETITFFHEIPLPADTPGIPVANTPSFETPAPAQFKPVTLIGIVLGVLGITTIVLLIVTLVNQRRQEDLLYEDVPDGQMLAQRVANLRSHQAVKEEEVRTDVWGILTVESSDDPERIGNPHVINLRVTRLGRSEDNDISFPKDNPVSRRHAVIEAEGGVLYLRQEETIDETSRTAHYPKYGTTLNDVVLVDAEPLPLLDGAVIGLGKRVRLRFEAYFKAPRARSLTYDIETESADFNQTSELS